MYPLSFKIKICGVTTAVRAMVAALVESADAVGLNFYPHSKRFVTLAEAREIGRWFQGGSRLKGKSPIVVGVFVNPNLQDIAAVLNSGPLPSKNPARAPKLFEKPRAYGAKTFNWIQLHGVETPEFLSQVKATFNLPIMRAFRWGIEGEQPINDYLQQCSALGCLPDAVLIDSSKPGEYGGTGVTADWDAIAEWKKTRRFDIPLVLAGGLTPDNVAGAIHTVKPDAVDTASGVESSPGSKDPELVGAFISAARRAFDEVGKSAAS